MEMRGWKLIKIALKSLSLLVIVYGSKLYGDVYRVLAKSSISDS